MHKAAGGEGYGFHMIYVNSLEADRCRTTNGLIEASESFEDHICGEENATQSYLRLESDADDRCFVKD
jgi:hypothetical protein